jgi:hypothetical protein
MFNPAYCQVEHPESFPVGGYFFFLEAALAAGFFAADFFAAGFLVAIWIHLQSGKC